MAIKITLKNSVVENSVPTTTHLAAVGELAVNANINSLGIYMRASDNTIVKMAGPGSLTTPAASTTVAGISEYATNTETTTGTSTTRSVTPAGLAAVTSAERSTSNSTYLALAGGTLAGVLQATAGSNSAPAIHFGDSDSGIYGGTNTVSLAAGGTQGLSLDSSAEVQIPTKLAINGAGKLSPLNVRGMTDGNLHIRAITDIHSGTGIGIDVLNNANNTVKDLAIRAANTVFKNASSESARLDSSGRLLVGHSSSVDQNAKVQASTTSTDTFAGFKYGANNAPNIIRLGKSRNASVGSNTILQDDDEIGRINFVGADGTDFNDCASIQCFVDGTPSDGTDMPGRLELRTSADGSSSPTTRLTIGSDGNATFTGNVNGVSADFSGNILVGGADSILAENNLRFKSAGAAYIDHNTTSQSINFRVSNSSALDTTPLVINSDGKIGIGLTTGIQSRLHVQDVEGTTLTLGNTDAAASDGDYLSGIDFWIKDNNDSTGAATASIRTYADQNHTATAKGTALAFHTTDDDTTTLDERMRITHDGNVGIGTTSPTSLLHVSGTGIPTIKLEDTDTAGGYAHFEVNGSALFIESYDEDGTGGSILFKSATTEAMRIDSARNVGINTSTPSTYNADGRNLVVGGNAANTGITIASSSATGLGKIYFAREDPATGSNNRKGLIAYEHQNEAFTFHTGVDERMRLNASGRLGLGVNPDTLLHLEATNTSVAVNNAIRISDADTAVVANQVCGRIEFETADSGNPGVNCQIDTIYSGNGGGGELQFRTGFAGSLVDALRIDDAGQKIVQNGKLNISSTYIDFSGSLGSVPTTAAAIYRPADNNLAFSTANTERLRIINGGGITFNGDTAAANALDGYEEGTWSPTVRFGGSDSGVTYGSNNGGSYTKIGRFVHVHGRIELSNKGSQTGSATIENLPFTCSGVQSGASSVEGGAFFGYQHNMMSDLDYHTPNGQIQATTTVVAMQYRNNSGDITDITNSSFENSTSLAFELFYPST